MRYFLENEALKVEVESFGAELVSVCKKQPDGSWQEYMWEADPAYWGKTSPILFPFIGRLEGGEYRYGGQNYPAQKHGFARDFEFEAVRSGKEELLLELESTEETLTDYPFSFVLEIAYRLEDSSVSVQWRVKNTGDKTMYFSIGGHPAFACPLNSTGQIRGKRTQCRIRLYGREEEAGKTEKGIIMQYKGQSQVISDEIDLSNGLITGRKLPVTLQDGELAVTEHLFDQDALVLAEQGVGAVGFLDEKGTEYVCLEADCPVWGIWSVADSNASYICIEPWWGICDSRGYKGDLEERPFTNRAEAGGVWEDGYRITFFKV